MNEIMSWFSSFSLTNDYGDEEVRTVQNVLLVATFSGVLGLSYALQRYRNSEKLKNAKIKDLTIINSELVKKCDDQKRKIDEGRRSRDEEEKKYKEIFAQIILIATYQHSNLSK